MGPEFSNLINPRLVEHYNFIRQGKTYSLAEPVKPGRVAIEAVPVRFMHMKESLGGRKSAKQHKDGTSEEIGIS